MQTNYLNTVTSLATNSQPNKKPIFITLKRTGNNIIFAKPQSTTTGPSKIPKWSISKSDHNNGNQGVKNLRVSGDQLMQTQSSQLNHYGYADARKCTVKSDQNQITTNQPQQGPIKTCTPVNINLIHNQKKSIKQLIETDKANSSSKIRDCKAVAPESKTISKQNPVKRSYKRKPPNQTPGTSKFNFPLPPPKIDFTVSTSTVFNTAIDETTPSEKPPLTSDRSVSSISNETTIDQSNGVPSNCPVFKKVLIDTVKSKGSKVVIRTETIASNPPIISNTPFNSKVPIASNDQGSDSDDSVTHNNADNELAPSETASGFSFLEIQETVGSLYAAEGDDQPVTTQVVDTITDQTEYGEIIKILGRIEAMHLASSKREAQILVAVKKLCLQYTKHYNDNDEIKKLLPMKEENELIAMDTRIIEDPVFKEKMIAFLRGYKTTKDPENFTAFFNVLLVDELVDKFNLKGILGKKKLEGYKIMEIIQDLHKPMDKKAFEKLMRTTIELAKNRFHNDQYRKRQQQKAQQLNTMDSSQ